jgi:hypothetical protein
MLQLVSIIVGISLINISLPFQKQLDFSLDQNNQYLYTSIAVDGQYQSYVYHTNVVIPANQKYQAELQAQELAQKLAQEEADRLALELQLALEKKKKATPKSQVSKSISVTDPRYSFTNASADYSYQRIVYWAGVYGVNANVAIDIAYCESGMRANAVGGRGLYLGIFQQHKNYFAARASRVGIYNANPFDPDHNAKVSLSMMTSTKSILNNWPSCGKKALRI